MTRYMLDIETASLDRQNALILSITLVEFRLTNEAPLIVPHGGLPSCALDLREQIALGRGTQPGTLEFWKNQSAAARDDWLKPPTAPLNIVLNAITDLFRKDPDAELWAHHILFDVGNLESLFQQCGLQVPWKHNRVFDVPSLTAKAPEYRARSAENMDQWVKHRAFDDCVLQIYDLWEHWNFSIDNADRNYVPPAEQMVGRIDV